MADGLLSPNGPAYSAFIVPVDREITLEAVQRLQDLAAAGLPIIFTGDTDQARYVSARSGAEADMQAELEALLSSENVYSVSTGGVADQLSSLGLTPRAKPVTNGTWYTTWTQSEDADFVFIFCDSEDSEGQLIVSTTKQPYAFDPWSGTRTVILAFEKGVDTTTIPLSLSRNQTMIIGFSDELPPPSRTIATCDPVPNLLGSSTSDRTGILHIARSEDLYEARLSDGESLSVDTRSVADSFELSSWNLVAELWEAPEDFNDAATVASKRNITLDVDTLASWLDIPELTNASGVGYYTTNFTWPPSRGDSDGAYISLAPINHALMLRVNGERVPPLNHARPVADISEYLVEGVNVIEVTVPTMMWNYIRTIASRIRTSGAPPAPWAMEESTGVPMPGKVENGLVGPVAVIPVVSVEI